VELLCDDEQPDGSVAQVHFESIHGLVESALLENYVFFLELYKFLVCLQSVSVCWRDGRIPLVILKYVSLFLCLKDAQQCSGLPEENLGLKTRRGMRIIVRETARESVSITNVQEGMGKKEWLVVGLFGSSAQRQGFAWKKVDHIT
jgi:hypothetical protein